MPVICLLLILSVVSTDCRQGGGRRHGDPLIVAVYPSGDSLPSNILRFYIQFSEPMRENHSLSHILVEGPDGKAMTHVFFDTNEELWNGDRTLLTLLVDPARVKTGLLANEQLGRSFVPGVRYVMTIEAGMVSMRGTKISKPFSKSFVALLPDTAALSVARWKIQTPAAHSSAALRIRFDRNMDYACALDMISIQQPDGIGVKGTRILKQREKLWEFVPVGRWANSNYRLAISTRLEDVSGNNFIASFDHRKDGGNAPNQEMVFYTFHISKGKLKNE